MSWLPIPEPMTWTLVTPITFNGMNYATVTLRAPTSGDILKATAVRGTAGLDLTLKLVEAVCGEHVPYEALKLLPAWLIMQMGDYMDEFMGIPAPDPLAAWRAARLAAATAEAKPATDQPAS